MNSDPTDGAAAVDPGNTGDPGIDQLFRILTTGPAPGELAGEQNALAMFRAIAATSKPICRAYWTAK